MKTVIFGDRNFTDYNTFKKVIEDTEWYQNNEITEVISGGAKGADTLAVRWAIDNNLPYTIYMANWSKYGRAAGPIRNKEMALIAEIGIGFLAPNSKGTKDMIKTCNLLGIPRKIWSIDKEIFLDI